MTNKRRSLVLVDESARHPFRASLPPHVCHGSAKGPRIGSRFGRDLRSALQTYFAGFAAVSIFIS